MIAKDIRGSDASKRVDALYEDMFRPGTGHVWTASDLQPTADGKSLYFTGQSFETKLYDGPSNGVYKLDLTGGGVRPLSRGRMFRGSTEGRTAHIESGQGGDKLVVTGADGGVVATIPIEVRVEAMAWSPNGRSLLVLGADPGADISGAEGGFALRGDKPSESWLPEISTTDAQDLWRRLYRWSDGDAALTAFTVPPVNVWEAVWLGDDAIMAIATDHHSEGSWYQASVRILDAATGQERSRYQPSEQIGLPAGSPDGQRWAAVEAFCSDRGIVCGTVTLDEGGARRALSLNGVEATDISWRDADRLLFAGQREDFTVVGEINVATGEVREIWASNELTTAGWYPKAVAAGDGDAFAVVEGYSQPPAIARLSGGKVDILADLAPSPAPKIPGTIRYYRWKGRDGLDIGGWLVLPEGEAKNLPLFMDIHGGPVSAHRNRYAAGFRAGPTLVGKGYALFLPNPRGSGGRGQDFAGRVKNDMGGEDMHDYLTGLDQLIADGIADPKRLAVAGTSYGGFMSAMLVAHTNRFAVAAPMSPVSNWYSQHYATQIPWFDEYFLEGSPREPGGQYFERSPAFFASNATTPSLVLAGGLDKNTPTNQAVEFYGALVEAGVEAALCIYPEDGHSLRGYPAYIDGASRMVDWFDRYIKV